MAWEKKERSQGKKNEKRKKKEIKRWGRSSQLLRERREANSNSTLNQKFNCETLVL